jgi:hypothetical protein
MPLNPNDRKHVVMWAAVGGTMLVIVALWVMILPSQLAQTGRSEMNFSRWYQARTEDTKSDRQSFSEVMAEQKAQLDALENSQKTNTSIEEAKNVQKIDELRAKIDAATNANANTNAPATSDTTAPAANVNATK